MTSEYDALTDGPQTGIRIGSLAPAERGQVHKLSVTGIREGAANTPGGTFQTVYYLEGDEQAAAEVFADVNADLIDALDLSKRNVLMGSLDRYLYDLVLDAAGERDIEWYETVVCETRDDSTQWVVDREHYLERPSRRYNKGTEHGSAYVPPATDLQTIFDEADTRITETTLRATAIAGDVRQVLDYYRVAPAFSCRPTTVDDELAVCKQATDTAPASRSAPE